MTENHILRMKWPKKQQRVVTNLTVMVKEVRTGLTIARNLPCFQGVEHTVLQAVDEHGTLERKYS